MSKLVKKSVTRKLVKKSNGSQSYWFDTITQKPWAGRARSSDGQWYIYGSDGTETLVGNSEYADAPVSQLDNVKKSYNVQNLGIINKGLQAFGRPLKQRSAILGNIFMESGGDPEAVNGSHYGIMQWSTGRYPSKNPSLLRQVEHTDSTMRVHGGNEWVPSKGRLILENPKSSLEDATNSIGRYYERPGAQSFPRRIDAAKIFNSYFATPRDSVEQGLIDPMFK